MTVETRQGRSRLRIRGHAVTLSFIQSMMVVTSPMGDQAPPLLAAMTITEAQSQRSSRSGTSARSRVTMTIAVVMLSSTADMKKATSASSHRSRRLPRTAMRRVTTAKPP